jgi:hypothetical protein
VGSALARGSQAATDAYRRARGGGEAGAAPLAAPAAPAAPAGWYADPHEQAALRYWDGDGWTPHTQ